MKQRVAMARALAQETGVLLMDEPFAALDAITRDVLHEELARLRDAGDKRVHELSGGMRQRVAMARALAQETGVLLMDEPFAALDAITRDVLHEELVRIRASQRLTVLFVTHNVREAVRLGDRVVLLSSRPGRVARQYAVDIAQPRRIESPEVAALSVAVTEDLRAEIRRHGGQS
jgi:NitT/TauT family transport system ATP-binding protein